MEKEKMSLEEALQKVSEVGLQEVQEQMEEAQQSQQQTNSFSLDFSTTFRDPSFWMLVASNAISIFFILKNHVPTRDVMLIYWMQSVIIGLVNFVRILMLKDFSVKGFKVNGVQAKATTETKLSTALFFLVHYGFFHVIYAVFILEVSGAGVQNVPVNWVEVLAIASTFLISHVFSFVKNFKEQTEGKNIGSVMFAPYARIVPMHIAIIIGAATGSGGAILLTLKAGIDLLTHAFKHKAPAVKNTGNI